MDEAEKLALRSLPTHSTKCVDPWTVLQHLKKQRVIDQEGFPRLVYSTSKQTEDAAQLLFEGIASKCTIADLKEALRQSGFNHVVEIIDNFLYHTKGKSLVSRVNRQEIRRKRLENDRYNELFKLVQNAFFKDPKLSLHQLSERFETRLKTEADPCKKAQLADSLVAVMSVEVDVHTVFGKPNFKLFEKLFEVVPQTSNPNITEATYYGRLGLANALDGNFEESENMLIQARCHVYNMAACMDFVYVFYCVIYTRLLEFEHNPSDNLLASIFDAFYMGMGYIAEADDGNRSLWRRMFLSRIVMALLGVAVGCKQIDQWRIRPEHVQTAKRLLAEMYETDGGMELRRKMLYYVLRARLYEVENDFVMAFHFISNAENCAKEGQFAELQNIAEFKECLAKHFSTLQSE